MPSIAHNTANVAVVVDDEEFVRRRLRSAEALLRAIERRPDDPRRILTAIEAYFRATR